MLTAKSTTSMNSSQPITQVLTSNSQPNAKTRVASFRAFQAKIKAFDENLANGVYSQAPNGTPYPIQNISVNDGVKETFFNLTFVGLNFSKEDLACKEFVNCTFVNCNANLNYLTNYQNLSFREGGSSFTL